MNKREAMIMTMYTGSPYLEDFSEFKPFIEKVLKRSVSYQELTQHEVIAIELKESIYEILDKKLEKKLLNHLKN